MAILLQYTRLMPNKFDKIPLCRYVKRILTLHGTQSEQLLIPACAYFGMSATKLHGNHFLTSGNTDSSRQSRLQVQLQLHLPGSVNRLNQHVQQTRLKYRQSGSVDSDDSDSDSEGGDEGFEIHFSGDSEFPGNYRELKKHLKSSRVDAVLGGGLSLSRKKIDDYFLESKILLNGEKLTKKSRQMQIGECVDLITENEGERWKIKRVRLVDISAGKSSSDRKLMYLRVWRSNVLVDKPVTNKKFL